MKISTIIFIIVGILIIFGVLIGGIIMGLISDSICKTECNRIDALEGKIIHSGNWKIDDLCVCYFEEGIKSFRLGRK